VSAGMIARAVAALALLAGVADAQVRKPTERRPTPQPTGQRPAVPGAPDQRTTMRADPRATAVARDTVAADTLAQFSAPDSTMAALLDKQGYAATRYEGEVVTFNARTRAFAITADSARRAQVAREGQHVVTDSVIVYREQENRVDVSGNFRITPGGGQPPLAGFGTANYDLREREGRLTNARVTVEESGERWFIQSEIGKMMQGDSARGIAPRFYGVGGSLTSCEDSVPDYHFRLREIKRTERTLVARPAIMYVRDIPVMWLPFIFQDIRPGRRSGILPLRVGVSDLVRNNPQYRRHIENIGFYWALSDYMDATAWVDWRSSAGGDSLDPGWYKLNAETKYAVMSRFLSGRLAASYQKQRNDLDNLAVSWGHQQKLGRARSLSANLNYVTSTRLQRQNSFNPYAVMATIRSEFTYADKIGPMSLQLGGDRTQYPGRAQVNQTLPTLTLNSGTLALAKWLSWTPSFSFREIAVLKSDEVGLLGLRFSPGTGGRAVDTTRLKKNSFDRTINVETPIRIFGFDLRNGFAIRDLLNDFPEEKWVYPNADSSLKERRIFAQTFKTTVDWNPTFSLPPFFQNRFKLTPSVSLANVDAGPFWIRTDLSGGRWVQNAKRLNYGLSASPTIFGLWPGFGPFQRFRHSVSPTLSYTFAPPAQVNREYLAANGQFANGHLGALRQSALSLGLSQNIEAKVAAQGDTSSQAQKIRVLSTQFTSLSYDFERARAVGRSLAGLTTENFGANLRSDLLPGFDLSVDWSLFQGSTISDTAEFKPFLTRVASTFKISQSENPFSVLTRLFGRAVPDQSPAPQAGGSQAASAQEAALARQMAQQPVAGQAARGVRFVVPPPRGWEATFNFSTTRYRRPRGGTVIDYDPRIRCEQFRELNPFAYQECRNRLLASNEQPLPVTTVGGTYVRLPSQTSLSGALSFELTRNWAAAWQTSYDFERSEFASHVVTLQRNLHDFRAVFAFTQSPNGNFAFNFFIALKPQPELKFDYSRATIRSR